MNRLFKTVMIVIVAQILCASINTPKPFLPIESLRVPVYDSFDPGNSKAIDTISHVYSEYYEEFTDFYDIEILADSMSRYKVMYSLAINDSVAPKMGWIDKEFVKVWLWPRFLSEDRYRVRVYERPQENSSYVDLFYVYNPYQLVTVLEIGPDNFLRVAIPYGMDIIYGWIEDYCPNPYDGCT